MFKFLNCVAAKPSILTNSIECQTAVQFVRWRGRKQVRKPTWLGTARSKLLRFPQWHPYHPGELDELKKLHNDYRHMTKSLICYFKEEYAKVSETSHIAAEKHKAEEQEHARLMEENRLENERVAAIRNARLAAEVKARHERLLRNFATAEEARTKAVEEADVIVRQKLHLATHAITLEMLDDAIEKAMDTEVDHNFAIDLEGNIYRGRHQTHPSEEKLDAVPESTTGLQITR